MMTEGNLSAARSYLAAIKADPSLQEKMQAAADPDAVAGVVALHSLIHVIQLRAARQDGENRSDSENEELSEADLSAVSGGVIRYLKVSSWPCDGGEITVQQVPPR